MDGSFLMGLRKLAIPDAAATDSRAEPQRYEGSVGFGDGDLAIGQAQCATGREDLPLQVRHGTGALQHRGVKGCERCRLGGTSATDGSLPHRRPHAGREGPLGGWPIGLACPGQLRQQLRQRGQQSPGLP